MSEIELVRKWLAKAQDDLISASHLFHHIYPKQIEICCYHCQQAAEKSLKGYLLYRQIDPPRTHDLVLLCNTCIETDPEFLEILDHCADLSPYAVQTRYPNEIELEEYDAELALKKANQVCVFITGKCSLD